MNVSEFMNLPESHSISPDEAKSLNYSISRSSAKDIPAHKVELVMDYITISLSMDSVDLTERPAMEKLLRDLQEMSY